MPAHYERTHDRSWRAPVRHGRDHAPQGRHRRVPRPARDPIALAKQVASLDVLSGGRFLFGVGAGWNAEEIEHHGVRARTAGPS